MRPPQFNGVDNFVRMLGASASRALGVTFGYALVSVPTQLAVRSPSRSCSTGAARPAFYRSIFYLPSLSGQRRVAAVWRTIFGGDGLLNQLLAFFGIQGQSWIASPDTALATLMALNVWTFGSPMVIFLAGLRQIPRMYHEAAAIDGANAVQRFGRITLPLLTPIIFFNLVLQVIHAFQAFPQASIVSGGTAGPADSTLFFTLYL